MIPTDLGEAPKSLWRHADFMKLWAAQTVSLFGTGIGGEALPLTAILLLGASPAQMGLLGALGSAPVFLLGLFAGAWADRTRRRPLMMAADLGRAAVLLSIPAAYFLGRLTLTHLFAAAALVGALGIFYDVAYQSLVPALVGRSRLLEANSKLGVSDSAAEVGGPALGGALVQFLGGPLTLLLDALSYLLSAFTLGAIRAREAAPFASPAEGGKLSAGLWVEIRAGLRAVWENRSLRAMGAAAATRNFFGSFFGALYALYVVDTLGLPPVWLGLLISSGGVGALLGALLAVPLARRLGAGRMLLLALPVSAGFGLLVPFATGPNQFSVALLLAVQVFGDLALAVYFIGELSLRQSLAPDRLLGRVNASLRFLSAGAITVGLLVGGMLGQAVGIRPTLGAAALGMLAAAAWLVFSPVRAERTGE